MPRGLNFRDSAATFGDVPLQLSHDCVGWRKPLFGDEKVAQVDVTRDGSVVSTGKHFAAISEREPTDMHYCSAHAALLPDDVPPLPMPDTRRQRLWLLAALHKRRQMGPVPHGPLASDRSFESHPAGPALRSSEADY